MIPLGPIFQAVGAVVDLIIEAVGAVVDLIIEAVENFSDN